MPKEKRLRSNPELTAVDAAYTRSKPNRPAKFRQWSDESMRAAMKAVMDGSLSINRSAIEHGVPKTTLRDRIAGKVQHGTNPGPKPYLTAEEEKDLEVYLIKCSQIGYGKTRRQVLQIVEKTTILKGIKLEKHVTDGWYRRFKQRLPLITIRRGDPYATIRANCSNQETYKGYFKLLKEVLPPH